MIFGIVFIILGLFGTFGVGTYINNDSIYTYKSPLTSHELTMLLLFAFSVFSS